MADVQVVDLRGGAPPTSGHRGRGNSLRKSRPSPTESTSTQSAIPTVITPATRSRNNSNASASADDHRYRTTPHAPPPPPSLLRTAAADPQAQASTSTSRSTRRVPVPNSSTVINVPAHTSATIQRQSSNSNDHRGRTRERQRTSSSASRTTPLTPVTPTGTTPVYVTSNVPHRSSTSHHHSSGRPHRTSSGASRSTHTTPVTPTTPVHVTSSNIRVRNQQPREQVMYIPSGQPIIIIDERRNKNTPLPTVIRDGKVVLGGDGRTRLEHLGDQPRTIVRSDPGTSVHRGHERHGDVIINRNAPTSASRFNELGTSGDVRHTPQSSHHHRSRSHSQSPHNHNGENVLVASDAASQPRRRNTWGHKNKRAPPFGHHDYRCHSNWHGLKDWWLGLLMRNKERRRVGNTEYEDAHRERDLERKRRQAEFDANLQAWREGRRDVPLW